MKKSFRRTFILLGVFFALWTFNGLYKWLHCNCNHGDIKHNFTDDTKSVIAWLGADNKNFPKLRIARFKVEEPYKYPFYSPKYLSDFYLLDLARFDSLVVIVDGKDTLVTPVIKQIKKIPEKLLVYNRSLTIKVATYHLDTIYTDNLIHKPSFSIFEQLIFFGPSERECSDKCP